MLNISRTIVRKLATNDTVYTRGVHYYKKKAILNVKWSEVNKQYKAIVRGSANYFVTIDVNEDDTFEYSCNCPANHKYKGACKHIVATLLFIGDYLERSKNVTLDDPKEKEIQQIINYFKGLDDLDYEGELYKIKVMLTIPSIIKKDDGRAYASLFAGNERYYKINNLKKFLIDYQNGEKVILGKHFSFNHDEDRFDKKSMEILEYFLSVFELEKNFGKVTYSSIFSKENMLLTKNMIIKLLKIIGNEKFSINMSGEIYEEVNFIKDRPELEYELYVEDNAISVSYRGNNMCRPLTDEGELLFFENNIYQPDKKFINSFLPFYKTLNSSTKTLVFKDENKTQFLENILPNIHNTLKIDIPKDIQENYISADLHTGIYLDKYKSGISARIIFRYDEYEFNPLDKSIKDDIIVIRQIEKENIIFEALEQMYFERYKNMYILKDEDAIYDFLTEKSEDLSHICDLYYSDDFKNITLINPSKLITKVNINSDINLLEMDFEYEGISKEELHELFRSLRYKKKYHRLQNGSFINLNSQNIKNIAEILEALSISHKELKKDKINLNLNNAIYLNSILSHQNNIIVKRDKQLQQLLADFDNTADVKYEIPENINAEIREYQKTGYKWLRMLADNYMGGILADDMGLGKTLQAILYIASYVTGKNRKTKKPVLVVCPTSLVYNWQEEINNFAPFITSIVISGTPEERAENISNLESYDVVITSYPLLRRDIEEYLKYEFYTAFIDEAQFIKNPNSLNSKSVKRINSINRFALTGTPIENSLTELWSIFDFVMPGYLLSHTKFLNTYEKPIIKGNSKSALEELNKRTEPFILRRMKKDVLKELPEKIEEKILTNLTDPQKEVYMSYLNDMKEKFKEGSQFAEKGQQLQVLAEITRLRQICCHPSTFIENYKGGSGKLELLMEIVPRALLNGHRILIFSQFTSMLKIIKEEFLRENISCFYLDGSTKIEDRKEYVKRFNAGENEVFLISLKAGGTGLNLTGADTVIHFDPWWNPATEEQATDRVYRIGQEKSVHVIKLVTKDTIEEKIYRLQKKKKSLSDSVIKQNELFINRLTKEEIEGLFN